MSESVYNSEKKDMKCSDCGELVKFPIDGVNVVMDENDNLYHAKCVEGFFRDGFFIIKDKTKGLMRGV